MTQCILKARRHLYSTNYLIVAITQSADFFSSLAIEEIRNNLEAWYYLT